jgi:cysteinyl-tRNA synthetase
MRLYNTLTRQVEAFEPLEEGYVRMYTCGPTVYDYAHIGNYRAFMFEDVLRRAFRYLGYRVTQVMNLTDIDDKIIKSARERGRAVSEVTKTYIDAFFEDLDTLGMERAEAYPRATEHIPEMIALVEKLLERGVAYRAEGGIFYRISEFPGYGRLSRFDLSQVRRGERVASDEYGKDDVRDFALWKFEDDPGVSWEAPFGRGRPGWHVECSAMSVKHLGETFDIHAGGVDNIFPHHENEIAQSEAALGKPFVRFWLHAEHLLVDGRKMAKSEGNFYTLRDLLARGHRAEAIRYLLLSCHYRKQLNFTLDGLAQAETTVDRYRDFLHRLAATSYPEGRNADIDARLREAKEKFQHALRDDLNVSEALGVMFTLMGEVNTEEANGRLFREDAQRIAEAFRGFDSIWALEEKDEAQAPGDAEIQRLVAERDAARASRDFKRADEIRDALLEKGIVLEDTPYGTRGKRKS